MVSIGRRLVALALLPLATAAQAESIPAPAIENQSAAAPAQPIPVIAAAPAVVIPILTDVAPPAPAIPVIAAAPAEAPVPVLAAIPAPQPSSLGNPVMQLAVLLADTVVSWAHASESPAAASADAAMDAELECMAKVVHHEAGNQSRQGQLAVAQLIMNRVRSGRFADTICGVANQPRQFFRTAAYNPRRDSAGWASAVEVSRQAREGSADPVAPGALFFHAAYAQANTFFQTRQRVGTLGGNVFYR